MKNKENVLVIFFIGIAFSVWGCSGNSGNQNNATINVQIEKVKPTDASQELAYSGTIEESETIPLSFSSAGTVSKVYVSEGVFVKKGQLLATLDDTTHQNAYAIAQAAEQQAEDAYKRLTPMHKNGNLPDVKYVEVETGLQKATAAAAIAKKNLDACNLCATTEGYIGKRSIELGMTATPNLAAITIVKINKVLARVSVSENEIALIHKGQKANITIGALRSAHYDGVVEEIGVVADPIVHTYKIKIGITNKDLSIKPGMICSATIESPSTVHGMVVPSRSVMVDELGKNFVYVVSSQNKAMRKYVVTGQLLNDGIEVLEGLQINDAVVVAGQHKLIDNASVQIEN
ncbi:MAG: efflux RND transporter periplasmic adaptor subunit [Bacteroidota bacterium]|jgi:RND family efflux transporter MFP subunit